MSFINNSFSISVVLPTYNRINRIKKCLPSFLKTKIEDVQFIIIDNNSDDGTWDYLQSVALNDKRVEIYRNPQNIGGTKSQFRGYCEVKSPYALFLADDDLMIGDYIARCLEIFQQHDDVSIVHHFFDGWQKEKKLYNEPYTIHSKGSESILEIFLKSGSYPGISLRMKNFHLKSFPLGEGVIYPQVKIALEVASKHKAAIINDCGMVSANYGDTALNNKEIQNRPDCMGINERLSYALALKNPLLIQKLAMGLAGWGAEIFEEIEKTDTEEAKKFVKSLAFTLNNVTPYFIISLLKIKRFKHAIYSLICLIRRPSFLINYIWFFVLFLSKVLPKLKLRLNRFY